MEYNKLTMVQLRETEEYKNIPRQYAKSKLRKEELINLLINLQKETSKVINTVPVATGTTSQTKNKTQPKQNNQKKNRDPNKPLSAYLLFCGDIRGSIVTSNPDMKATDIIKTMVAEWEKADENTRRKYESLFEKEKGRYDREMEVYTKNIV